MVEEGYAKHEVFKIATWDRWMVFVSGPDMNDEISKLPDDVVSLDESIKEFIYSDYTLGPNEHNVTIPAIHGLLTRNLSDIFPAIVDEIELVLEEMFPSDSDWVEISNLPNLMLNVIARIANRIFVGTAACHNPEYLKIVTTYATNVVKAKLIMDLCPKMFRPLIGYMLPWRTRAMKLMEPFLSDVIADHQLLLDEPGSDLQDGPNKGDFLMWLAKGVQELGSSSELMLSNVLVANFAGLHTSTMVSTSTLFQIASTPECVPDLRKDILSAIEGQGWTRNAVNMMGRLDSFIKETQRFQELGIVGMRRKTLKTVILSNGTVIPADVNIYAPSTATHHDSALYDDPGAFKPNRFFDKGIETGEPSQHQFVSMSPEYIAFGHGKHACPGRFFAVLVIKTLIANLLLKYDLKMGGDGSNPKTLLIGTSAILSRKAKVLFKRRQSIDA
ncbi:cytochrome P450 [Wolfiporia cocos MD-104 SS10]|uniref:Cytochrome P450 n=1 Tax=Wolfiporia cocos (strain MD-104) TaxID=742152 RepID=A0A2H3J1C4_WOLCO|nr:cytochrome P450 [Wolfiporia cocos MD-104 SS10]